MRVRGLSCIILLAAALAGCGDSAGPEKDEDFILAVMVTDTGGQPMAGMKVGRLNKLDGYTPAALHPVFPADTASTFSYPNPFYGSTVIDYSTAAVRDVLLEVFDWRGRHVKTILNGRIQAGFYSAHWDGKDADGEPALNGLYTLRLTFTDTLDVPEYSRESNVECTLFDYHEPNRTEMGRTDQTGFFSVRDLDLFPSLQGHGPQDAYDATATYLGTFSFSDTVTIRVSTPPPPGAGKIYHMSCETALVNGPNYLEFAFVPDDSTEVPITSVR